MWLPVVMVPELLLLVLKVLPVLGVPLEVSVHLLHVLKLPVTVCRSGYRLLPVWRHSDTGRRLWDGEGGGEPVVLGPREMGEGGGCFGEGAGSRAGLLVVTIEYFLHESVETLSGL